ncbi:MAG: NADH-quinone oxidoreductase subunit NuoG [Lysobacterales bacterium]
MSDTPVATDTVTIEIDGVEMQAPKGSMIIESADKAGMTIPRFCYHEKLSIAANCRMCLVDVEKAPKPLPACATPVMDGMKVYTQSRRAQKAQQNVMEFLLINHPLDCPICDQGGECELQDVSMGYGHSASRFTERKRVVKDEDLGSLISTDMTRCIHCTRCVRFLDEISGTNELGGIGRGERTFISTFIERSVDSELSGNIIDLCPVGALTNKPFRFSARSWELRARPAIANHDCIGSNLHYHVRRGKILRSVPRDNDAVNESWLADRDRWGFHGLQGDDRATTPMLRRDGEWQEVSWDEAIEHSASMLKSSAETGYLLSPNASNEELYLAQKLARALGSKNIDHRLRERDLSDQQGLPMAPSLGQSLAQLAENSAILLVAANVRHEQPLIGHRVRQAWRSGAKIFSLASRQYNNHFDCAVDQVVSPAQIVSELAAVAVALDAVETAATAEMLRSATATEHAQAIAEGLKSAESATVMLGHAALTSPHGATLRALCQIICSASGATYAEPPLGANGVGAWKLGALPHREAGGSDSAAPGLNARQMINGQLDAMLVYDFEPMLDLAEGADATEALTDTAQVIHVGPFITPEILQYADVILPLAPMPETEGSLTNVEGLIQGSAAAAKPAGEARPGWKIIKALADAANLTDFDFTDFVGVHEQVLEVLASVQERGYEQPASLSAPAATEALATLVETPIYAGNAVVRRSLALQKTAHGEDGQLTAHPDVLSELGLLEGEVEAFVGDGDAITVELTADATLAPATVRISAGTAAASGLVGADQITLRAVSSDE